MANKFSVRQNVVVDVTVRNEQDKHLIGKNGVVKSVHDVDPFEPHLYKIEIDGTGTVLTFWEDELEAHNG